MQRWLLILAALCLLAAAPLPAALPGESNARLNSILSYIAQSWGALTRSMAECKSLHDPKSPGPAVLYFPADFQIPASANALEQSCPVKVERLPRVIHKIGSIDPRTIHPQGLLYLPHPYVVPGGMFNEMYGWDSYFILRGLLRVGKLDLARGIVENFLFEVEHYGGVLNANRTYYLTRSQPPFLTRMVRAVYQEEAAHGHADHDFLKRAYGDAVKDWAFWNRAPHLAGETGLSRYYDFGQGPAPELGGIMTSYYRHAAAYFLQQPQLADSYLVRENATHASAKTLGPLFPVYVCNPVDGAIVGGLLTGGKDCELVDDVGLSAAFYKGDRSLRESGFDVTFKFGPFGAATIDYAPVGLNCLLYQEEKDLEWMAEVLGKRQEARAWRGRAQERRERITKYFWNSQRGLYFDYNSKTGKQSNYVYATTFYPLWVGAASPAQAQAVMRKAKSLEEPGGVVMSLKHTGAQWDYPYGWAPIELIAVEGLRRYGGESDADRISKNFISMVAQNFRRDRTIREKYNVVTRSSETAVSVGYSKNQIGFGWTNGVFLVLLHELQRKAP